MEIMQETSNEQAQRIAELEDSLSKAEEAASTLDKRAAAQTQLIRASAFAMAGQKAQVKAEIDRRSLSGAWTKLTSLRSSARSERVERIPIHKKKEGKNDA